MHKKSPGKGQTLCLSNRSNSLLKSKLVKLAPLTGNSINSIASIKEAEERIWDMEKRHRWRRERRLRKLHDLYDQNCRLYMSINSQKSIYAGIRDRQNRTQLDPSGKGSGSKSRRYDQQNKPQQPIIKLPDEYRIKVRQILMDCQPTNRLYNQNRSPDNLIKRYLTLNACKKEDQKLAQKYFLARPNKEENENQSRTEPLKAKRGYRLQD